MAWRDAGWIFVIVLSSSARDADERGTEQRRIAKAGRADGRSRCSVYISAEKARLKLLVRGQPGNIDRIHAVAERNRSRHKAAVISPVKAHPWTPFPRLILQVGRLVELFVVVDAEHAVSTLPRRGCADARQLRLEESGRDAGHHNQRAESVKVRYAGANRIPWDFRALPFNRKGDRSAAQHAKVVRAVRVFPNIVGTDDQVFPERLLQTSVEFVSPAGDERIGDARIALQRGHQGIDYRIAAAGAGQDQVFVERRFKRPSVGNTKDGMAWLDVVGDAQARLGLRRVADPVVNVAANSQVERPVFPADCVLDV